MSAPVNVLNTFGYVEILDSLVQVDVAFGYLEYVGNPITGDLLLIEDWDSVTPPAVTGWTVTDVTGTTGDWVSVASATAPTQKNGVTFNSNAATATHSTRLWRNTTIDMTAQKGKYLAFWMYHDTANSAKADTIQVQTSIDGGANWTSRGSAVARYAATAAWTLHIIDLVAVAAEAAVNIGFLATGAGASTAIFMDAIYVQSIRNTQIDVALGYLEYTGGCAQVDTILGYIEVGNGNTPAVIFGPRWQ